MLVLNRKPKQTIKIGDGITITLLTIDRGQVKLGIDAPRELLVLRGELEKHERKTA